MPGKLNFSVNNFKNSASQVEDSRISTSRVIYSTNITCFNNSNSRNNKISFLNLQNELKNLNAAISRIIPKV
jgi:hypothetical protein